MRRKTVESDLAERALRPGERDPAGLWFPIYCGYYTAGPAPEPVWDIHYGLELGVVLSGRMRRFYRQWEADVHAGQVWLCGMWERHGWQPLAPGCRYAVIVIQPRVLLSARFQEDPGLDWLAPFTVAPQHRPQTDGADRAEMLTVLARYESRVTSGARHLPVLLELLTLELLLVLLKDWDPPTGRYTPSFEAYYDIVSRAVELALEAKKPLTTAVVAKASGLSPGTFARAFEGLMGISFSRFALRSRLSQAAAQLADTEDPIAAIAADWGFTHVSQFERSFKEHYRVSPTGYRRARRR